ncbi:ABC-three component system middle component 2 [Aliikangiella sp. IMCC44359]|uniref:ABC-three component system middle component 2 n=1 Tax=Aliikangiella sp. IMCC44359 TaxID=3459125 RepID=UPI00403ACB12
MSNAVNLIFNSPIELGTRSSLVLTALEIEFSIDDLVLLDYALLYSGDFGGPENLHPSIPNHIAEIGHRREFLPSALKFFVKRGLIDFTPNTSGYYYSSNQQTMHFISCLKSSYYKKAWARLNWLQENYKFVIAHSFPTYKV